MIKPNEDFVLVRVDSDTEDTNSLILPKHPQDTFFGTIESMGPGRILESGKHIRPKFDVGNRVIIPTGAGRALLHEKACYVFVHATEILGTLENGSRLPDSDTIGSEGLDG